MPIAVLSPAKTIDESPCDVATTAPPFAAERAELLAACAALSKAELRALMGISEPLASLNHRRFAGFEAQPPKPACWAFDGPAHKALDLPSLPPAAQAWAQERVVTLSGLYGCLRARDAVRPYRLEMGSRLATARGETLYEFWGDRVARELADRVAHEPRAESRFVVNCASEEYWKVLGPHAARLGAKVYTIKFPGPSVHAKQARGLCRPLSRRKSRDARAPQGVRRGRPRARARARIRLVDERAGGAKGELTFARVDGDTAAKPPAGAKRKPASDARRGGRGRGRIDEKGPRERAEAHTPALSPRGFGSVDVRELRSPRGP